MSDSIRQMDEGKIASADFHSQRTVFAPAAQMEQSQGGGDDPATRHGNLEPDDSRNVTGASGQAGIGSPGGSDQQQGGERWSGGQQGQTETPPPAGAGGRERQQQQQQAEEDVEFDADPTLDPGEEVEFDADDDLSAQSQHDV